MSPPLVDREVVVRRLRSMADALVDLDQLRGMTSGELTADPIRRAAAERLLQVIVDLAIDINAHIVTAELSRAPQTGRESFIMAAEIGVLSSALVDRIAPSAGLRNVLVHRYLDIDPEVVATAITSVGDDYREYQRAIAEWLEARS